MLTKLHKTLLSLALIASAGVTAIAAPAIGDLNFDIEQNGLYYILDNDTDTASLTRYGVWRRGGWAYTPYSLSGATVPATITHEGKVYNVTIESGAFSDATQLQTLIIEEGITGLPDNFASQCSGLYFVQLPQTLKSIGDGAFYYCNSLQSIILPKGIESIGSLSWSEDEYGIQYEWGNGTFENSGLVSIDIPGSVKVIPSSAFNSCNALRSATLHEGTTALGRYAFGNIGYNYPVPNEFTLNIPSTVDSIHTSAFYRTMALRHVDLPDGLKLLGSTTFNQSGLEEISLPASINIMASRLLYETQLKSLTIPATIDTINPGAIAGNRSMTSLTIAEADKPLLFNHTPGKRTFNHQSDFVGAWLRNNKVEELYLGRDIEVINYVPETMTATAAEETPTVTPFETMASLHTVTIGKAVTDARCLNLSNYPALETIIIDSPVPPAINMPTPEQMAGVKVLVPIGSIEAYRGDTTWNTFESIAEDEKASITDINSVDSMPVLYFNLQGVQVDNPVGGVFLRRQGSKVTKVRL